MPFASEKQRRFMYARHPAIAKRWSAEEKQGNPGGEAEFRKWYAGHAAKLGLNPDPDAPQHHYDYRAAYRAGAKPDASGHWPSAHKRAGHPRLAIGGIDTRTGRSVMKRGTVARVKARMAADEKRRREEREKRRVHREYEASLRQQRARTAAKPVIPLTPAQIRSKKAEELRERIMPKTPLEKLIEALRGKKD